MVMHIFMMADRAKSACQQHLSPSLYLTFPFLLFAQRLHILPPFIYLSHSLSVCVWSPDTAKAQLTHGATQGGAQASLSTQSAAMSDQLCQTIYAFIRPHRRLSEVFPLT